MVGVLAPSSVHRGSAWFVGDFSNFTFEGFFKKLLKSHPAGLAATVQYMYMLVYCCYGYEQGHSPCLL